MLVSARNTHAVYEIRRSDGAVLSRLGGKRSDFVRAWGPPPWQHDARLHGRKSVTIFDNGAEYAHRDHPSRAILLRLDEKRRRAVLVRSYRRHRPTVATSEGNAQALGDGHILVGWGSRPFVTEFSRDGRVLLDLRLGPYGVRSYRSFRFPWTGHPVTKPAVAARRSRHGTTVYVSWNGATKSRPGMCSPASTGSISPALPRHEGGLRDGDPPGLASAGRPRRRARRARTRAALQLSSA